MIEKPDVCLYHFPCLDGFAAATVVHMVWPDVELRPINYGADMWAKSLGSIPNGRKLLFADFFPGAGNIHQLLECSHRITVLDHHKTAKAEARELLSDGTVAGIFDMQRSGAGIVWDELNKGAKRPRVIDLIEDRDIWKWKFGEVARNFHAYLASHDYDLELWASIIRDGEDQTLLESMVDEGSAIRRKHLKDIRELINQTLQWRTIQGHHVPVLNIPYTHGTEACHELLQMFPDAPFAAYYVESSGQRRWGFRSEDSRVDVSAIAKAMGGGGHRNAAGAEERT